MLCFLMYIYLYLIYLYSGQEVLFQCISIETILSVQFASHYIKSHLNLMSNSCHGIVTP